MKSETPHKSTEKSPERAREFSFLQKALRDIAQQVNAELQNAACVEDKVLFVDEECRVVPRVFLKENGGPYEQESVVLDENTVGNHWLSWSGATEERVKEFYQTRFGISDEKGIIARFQAERKKAFPSLTEMFITYVLHKLLSPEYLVVRSSEYDDFERGVDHLIVEKKTGVVVCAFDGVSDDPGGKRATGKIQKVIKQALKGGASIKYGLTFDARGDEGARRVVRKAISGVPNFYLQLSRKDIQDAVYNTQESSRTFTPKEKEVIGRLFASIELQIQELLKEHPHLPSRVAAHVKAFSVSFSELKRQKGIS